MHPHLLYQLAQARNDEIRQSAWVSATRTRLACRTPVASLAAPDNHPTDGRWPRARSVRDRDPL
jgi:hypothetical protein